MRVKRERESSCSRKFFIIKEEEGPRGELLGIIENIERDDEDEDYKRRDAISSTLIHTLLVLRS